MILANMLFQTMTSSEGISTNIARNANVGDVMQFMMRIICPSLPHSVHIRALALFIIFSLKVIIDITLMSSSSRSNELLSVEGYVGLFLSLKTFESKLFCHSKESVKILLVNISFPIVKEVYHGNQIIIPNRTPFMNTNG